MHPNDARKAAHKAADEADRLCDILYRRLEEMKKEPTGHAMELVVKIRSEISTVLRLTN